MGYKLGLIAGTAAGYLLGARAGRTRYEEIKKQSAKAWNSEPVQKTVSSAQEAAKEKLVDAAETVKTKTPEAAHGLVDKAVSAVVPEKDAKAAGSHEHHAEVTTQDRNF